MLLTKIPLSGRRVAQANHWVAAGICLGKGSVEGKGGFKSLCQEIGKQKTSPSFSNLTRGNKGLLLEVNSLS